VKLGVLRHLGHIIKLRGFENRVQRRISEEEVDKLASVWRKLHNEKFYNL
jgi:hypothetical protein